MVNVPATFKAIGRLLLKAAIEAVFPVSGKAAAATAIKAVLKVLLEVLPGILSGILSGRIPVFRPLWTAFPEAVTTESVPGKASPRLVTKRTMVVPAIGQATMPVQSVPAFRLRPISLVLRFGG